MRRALFMHIPKTAGMSVLVYMRNVYKSNKRLELRWQDNTLQTVSEESVLNADFIWLHEPLLDLKYNSDSFYKFTFLREPESRIRSLFTYLRDPEVINNQDFSHTPSHVVESLRKIEKMTFDEYVLSDDPIHQGHISNSYFTYFRPNHSLDPSNYDECLVSCIEYMENNFDYVGTTKTLSKDMQVIKNNCFPQSELIFGSNRINVSKKENVDLTLSTEACNHLDVKLAMDKALYEHASNLQKIHVTSVNNFKG